MSQNPSHRPRQTAEEQRAVLAEVFIGMAERKYRASEGNPVHASRAFRMARHLKVPPPAWVLEAIDRIAKEPEAQLIPSGGGPGAVSQADTDDRDYAIIHTIKILTRGASPRFRRLTGDDGAFAHVAQQYHLSCDHVQKIYYERWRRTGDPL